MSLIINRVVDAWKMFFFAMNQGHVLYWESHVFLLRSRNVHVNHPTIAMLTQLFTAVMMLWALIMLDHFYTFNLVMHSNACVLVFPLLAKVTEETQIAICILF